DGTLWSISGGLHYQASVIYRRAASALRISAVLVIAVRVMRVVPTAMAALPLMPRQRRLQNRRIWLDEVVGLGRVAGLRGGFGIGIRNANAVGESVERGVIRSQRHAIGNPLVLP